LADKGFGCSVFIIFAPLEREIQTGHTWIFSTAISTTGLRAAMFLDDQSTARASS
jgi:hypothetical protein